MAIICRTFELPAEPASQLQANTARLPDTIRSARVYGDVYRYWHAIEYLLTQHAPTSPEARWLNLGATVSAAAGQIPAARLIPPGEVAQLDRLLQTIEPEQLAAHYDAAELDAAAVYPGTWREWEETFDPLGQVLEHYSFLQSRARSCADGGFWLLLVFEELEDGSV
jgi:uncharacterized protein DUF1877